MLDVGNMIFVFGSNLSGIHGAGSALYAYRYRDAIWGVGEGVTGTCYALPTKGLQITPMDITEIKESINTFIKYSKIHKNQKFQITQVGCGLGGFRKENIAPLFKEIASKRSNCYFDLAWKNLLPKDAKFWGKF